MAVLRLAELGANGREARFPRTAHGRGAWGIRLLIWWLEEFEKSRDKRKRVASKRTGNARSAPRASCFELPGRSGSM